MVLFSATSSCQTGQLSHPHWDLLLPHYVALSSSPYPRVWGFLQCDIAGGRDLKPGPTNTIMSERALLLCLQDMLHYQYHIEVPVKCIQGGLYVRISGHVYNELADYQKLADSVLDLVKHGTGLDGDDKG